MRKIFAVVCFAVLLTPSLFATIFVVPDDDELVAKSDAIVTGVVISARAVEVEPHYVETFYEIAISDSLKGPFQERSRIEISSPGGVLKNWFTHVESAAHFMIGDEVLLFLTPHRGGWTPTDMTLGKFRFATSSAGYGVLVRDADDIVGWDRDGKVHKEKLRLENEFLHFIRETVAGRRSQTQYQTEARDVLAIGNNALQPTVNAASPAHTYAVSLYDCAANRYPGRWETADMTLGVPYYKASSQDASGLGDGGESIIQNALASWTNDCDSAVNITYAGEHASLKNPDDNRNMIIFNDPGGHVPGSWGGSGTIATAFSSGGNTHTFEAMDWVSFSDGDVVFQNGYAGTEATINVAMTHEIGHTIGLRHADKHYLKSCTAPGCVITCNPETACVPAEEECSSSAVMTAVVSGGFGFTLQAWDQHGAEALYPDGACVVLEPPTNVVATATTTTNVQVTYTAAVGAVTYKIYRSDNGSTFSSVGTTASTTFNDTTAVADAAYLYKVVSRDVTNVESDFSNVDIATTVIFTDPTITAESTKAKAAHITELRSAVNAVNDLAGLEQDTFTDPTLNSTIKPKAVHISELRAAIDEARESLSLSPLTYTDPTTTAQSTKLKGAHISELRNGVN